MAKYNAAKIEECEAWVASHGLIEYGGAKLKEFVREMGIDEKTYRLWMRDKPPFKEAINRAKDVFKQNLTHDLAISLAQAAKGYEHEEVEQEFRVGAEGQPTPFKLKKKKVHVQPNIGAAIFLLTNLDPDHYQNRQHSDVNFRKDEERPLTLEEINAEIERIDKLEQSGIKDSE